MQNPQMFKKQNGIGEMFVKFEKNYTTSVQFSHSGVTDALRPHELKHTRPLCPSPTPEVHSNSRPSSRDAIEQSHPLSFPSPPAPKPFQHQSFPMSQLFA